MQRIRATLLGSTLFTAMAVSGVAAAGGGHASPIQGGVPHAADSPPTHTHADKKVKAVKPGPGHARTIEMQRSLAARNLYQGKVDGVWGPKTEAALRNFQTQNGLESTGDLNAPTAEKLGLEPERQTVSGTDARNNTSPSNTSPSNARPNNVSQPQLENDSTHVQLSTLSMDQVKEMQQRLQLLGYYRGTIDGTVGEGTRAALQKFFQRQADLASKGAVSNAAISLFGTEPNEVQPVSGTDNTKNVR